MIKSLLKKEYIQIYILMIFMSLFVFGKGIGLHYIIAPYLLIFSLLMLAFNKIYFLTNLLKWLIFLIPITLISSLNFFYFNAHTYTYIQYVSYSLTGCIIALAFYSFLQRYPHAIILVYYLFMLFFILSIYRYFRSEDIRLIVGSDQHQNNAFYYVLMPLPLLLLTKSKIIKCVSVSLVILICFLSLKRSAVIVISVITLMFLWFDILKGEKKILTFLLFVFVFFIMYVYADKSMFFERYEMLMTRLDSLSEDGGSGRTYILERFWNYDINDLKQYPYSIFGKGFASVNNKYPDLIALHNDWLEMFYSFGISGLIIMLAFFIQLIKRLFFLYKSYNAVFVAYLSAVIIFFFYSFVGGVFSFLYLSLPLFCFFGVVEAIIVKKIDSNII